MKMALKALGLVRKLDSLGRIVIPVELRRTMDVEDGDSIEIFTDSDRQIVLKKYNRGCHVHGCSQVEGVVSMGGVSLCSEHAKDFYKATLEPWPQSEEFRPAGDVGMDTGAVVK